jgi:hypothetical protein
MEKRLPAANSISAYLLAALLLAVIGWGGLFAVLLYTHPSGGTRWLFFFTLVLAVTGTLLPVIAFLNLRFSTIPPAPVIIIRQSLWFGVYAATLAWLQIGRVLSPMIALLLALGLIIIEWLLRLRERSQWKP